MNNNDMDGETQDTPPRAKTTEEPQPAIGVRFMATIASAVGSLGINLATSQKDVRLGTLAFFVAVVLTLWGTLLPGLRRKIALRMTVILALVLGLVCFLAAFAWAQRPLYETDFAEDEATWAARSDETGGSRYLNGGYEVTPNNGYAVWRSAPTPARPAAVIVSATAQLNGHGGWGIWCRGTPDGRRYEFSFTAARVAYIKTPADEENVTFHPVNVNPNRPANVQARCEDLPDQVVHLTMWVNGVIVAERYDNSPELLGPGPVGVHAFGYGDSSSGERPQALFQHFELHDGFTVD